MTSPPNPRVFISYSHEKGQAIHDSVYRILSAMGVHPWSDSNLSAGLGFTEQIQRFITHSHVFLPILTPHSHQSGWVHQEIGFAAGVRVPCVPLCVGQIPGGMIQLAHAVVVNEQLTQLDSRLRQVDFAQLATNAANQWAPPSSCAGEPEERARMIEELSNTARANLGACCVRIQGGLSSFSLPDEPPDHPVWGARYGQHPRSAYAYQMFRRERQALQRHAVKAGVRLIINHGLDVDREYGPGARRTRLTTLCEFLESLPNELVTIALVDAHPPDLMVAVGDWFVAESSAARPVRGVIQTVFTAHAPTVSHRIAEFDRKLDSLVATQGSASGMSREWAVARLRDLIQRLPPAPKLPA